MEVEKLRRYIKNALYVAPIIVACILLLSGINIIYLNVYGETTEGTIINMVKGYDSDFNDKDEYKYKVGFTPENADYREVSFKTWHYMGDSGETVLITYNPKNPRHWELTNRLNPLNSFIGLFFVLIFWVIFRVILTKIIKRKV